MRELLLQNNLPNGKVIVSLALPLVIFGVSHQLIYFNDFRYEGSDVLLIYTGRVLLMPFLTLFVWAFTLTRIKSPNKLYDILLPSVATAAAAFVLRSVLNTRQSISEQPPLVNIAYFIMPFISYPIVIIFTTTLFNTFKNKILLYVVAGVIQAFITQLLYSVARGEIFMSDLIHNIPFAAVQYFVTLYIFTLFQINWKTLDHIDIRKQELRRKAQDALDANTPRDQLAVQLAPEFPDFNKVQLADVIDQTAAPADLEAAKTINTIVVVLLSLASLGIIVLFFGEFEGGLSNLGWHNPLRILLYILMPAFLCVRLYITCGIIEYKPYAYRLLFILAILGIILHIGFMFYAGFSGTNFIAVICNAGVLWFTKTLSQQLYPDYSSADNG